jgi:hypothetical protein
MSSRGCSTKGYSKLLMELIDPAKTRFEYLWGDETEMKSKEPGGELVQPP